MGASLCALLRKDPNPEISHEKAKTEDTDVVSAQSATNEGASNSVAITMSGTLHEEGKKLREATIKGKLPEVESILRKLPVLATRDISSDGSTVLHIAVGVGHNDIVKKLVSRLSRDEVLHKRNSDGCTALHIAAIVGNKHAAELLIKKNKELLRIKDNKGEDPLHKAYATMHMNTIGYLLKAVNEDGKAELQSSLAESVHPHVEIGVDLLVHAISAKQYSLALELVKRFPEFASKSDDVLMAIAKTFPSGLDYMESLIYPSPQTLWNHLAMAASTFLSLFMVTPIALYDYISDRSNSKFDVHHFLLLMLSIVPMMLASAFVFAYLLLLIVCYILLLLYFFWWKGARMLFAPIKQIEKKQKEWNEAIKVLVLVCDQIDNLENTSTRRCYYKRPILEAACQNACEVVDEILYRSLDAIQSKDKDGYDIIQLAIIHRSENVYNLIYEFGERKNLYRTVVDSKRNNILHLAGKLAPLNVLNQRTGAALQLQRELQWREEVMKLVFPTYITQENDSKETPDMVFTREHEKLVKEGEQWMKTTAESCTITASLITTIVFAAAITVPGGNTETGTPLFEKETTFIIFAISDAISLFASSTALLVFLSILTARFAEKDFLLSLPRRLFIGLFSLLLSTTTMIVAFSATLFLVFCEQKRWMLAPICGLAFIPIASFVTLQFPLMVDLFRSSYLPIFGKQSNNILRRFNPDDIRLRFHK